MRPNESPDLTIINRREAIRRAALLAGVAVAPEWLAMIGEAQTSAAKAYLPPALAATLAAAADRILPRTDTPGAADVGVPAFVDRLYGEFMTPSEQQLLTRGLHEIDAAAQASNGAGFSMLTAPQQDAVLRGVAKTQQGKEPSSFELLRSATVLGYFTSEEVGRNVLHYDPVPGAYNGCVPLDQVGRRNWTT
jgi:glucoside 3-dehydrogenase (cytochrome c) hitch-hiker subunit